MTVDARPKTRKSALGPMPEVWGPFRSPHLPPAAPRTRCTIMAARPLPPYLDGAPASHAETQALMCSPQLHQDPAIRRLATRLTEHSFGGVLAVVTRFACELRERNAVLLNETRPPLLITIANVARHIDARLLAKLAALEVQEAQALLLAWLASAGRLAEIWRRGSGAASDRELPERRAILAGPDAMRAFVAGGGGFSAEPDSLGHTDAHIAALATFDHAEALATFLELGGPFHDHKDRHGRTPCWHVVGCGRAEAVTAFLAVGGRLTECTDAFGCDLLAAAEPWGEAMTAIVRAALRRHAQ